MSAEQIHAQSKKIVDAIDFDAGASVAMPALVDAVASILKAQQDPEGARNLFVRQLDETLDLLDEIENGSK